MTSLATEASWPDGQHAGPTLVVATDFSPSADRALRRAAQIAQHTGAELHALHVMPPAASESGHESLYEPLRAALTQATRERLQTALEALHRRTGVQAHAAYRTGRPHRMIAEYAQETGAGLVVVGARGESTLLRLLLGSTANRLLDVRHAPVLVVRRDPVAAYRRVLVAVDLTPVSRPALAWALRVADAGQESPCRAPDRSPSVAEAREDRERRGQGRTGATDARIDLLHVLPEEDEHWLRRAGLDPAAIERRKMEQRTAAEALLANLARTAGEGPAVTAPLHRRLEPGYAPATILDLAERGRADLIVLGRTAKKGMEEFLLGSVSKDVAQAAECDVLIAGEEWAARA